MARQNKKLVVTSIISVALCGALLAGSSFAWFTDKVVNEDNSIKSGDMVLEVTGFDITELSGGSYVLDKSSGHFLEYYDDQPNSGAPLFTETNWEPGQSNAKYLQIHNDGSLAFDVSMKFVETANSSVDSKFNLADVIWFNLYKTDVDSSSDSYDPTPLVSGRLSDINEFIAKDIQLLPDDADTSTYADSFVGYVLEYGMDEEAGNEYQTLVFNASIEFNAKQSTYEKDGFGSDEYDANAENAGQDATVTTEGNVSTINLSTDATVAEDKVTDFGSSGNQMVVTNDLVINGNGNVLDMNGSFVYGQAGCDTITIKNVTIVNPDMTNTCPLVMSMDAKTIILENVTFTNGDFRTYFVKGGSNTEVIIKDCTFSSNYTYNPAKGIVSGANNVTVTGTTLNGVEVEYTK